MRAYSKFCIIFLLLSMQGAWAQSVVQQLSGSDDGQAKFKLFDERIYNVSPSRRIFLISNESQGYAQGDFVSFLLENKLVSRGLVAKIQGERAGIKIVKIYSLRLWRSLKKGSEIQVLRGDDSIFRGDKKPAPQEIVETEKAPEEERITSEEDLYNEKSIVVDDDVAVEENSKRIIKSNNVVGAFAGMFTGLDNNGSSDSYLHYGFDWSYQFFDNIWAQALFGYSSMSGFPASDLDSKAYNYTLRVKYAFNLPFDSCIMPYLGFQYVTVSSPDAGVFAGSGSPTDEQQAALNKETQLVDDAEKADLVIGATIMKRLVPGWFARLDLGTDVINLGFSLEF